MTKQLQLYKDEMSLALLTDLYQLTMAESYWKNDMAEQEAVFHLFFRECPFDGEYAIAAGLHPVVEFLEEFSFEKEDLNYLQSLEGNDGGPMFDEEFLKYLSEVEFECDIDAVPEGSLVFAHEPIVRVKGPLMQCQLLETALLNIVNFQTLIATKASRICRAAQGEPVLEFGLRRAQGIDGGVSASRAAIIGGCAATSNVLAGKIFDVPVKGTHAHSWVMSFDTELESFEAYADAMPNNCVFLVDTYNTIEGVKNAVKVGKKLRENGYEMVGIRLDSGDLAWLSKEARRILDENGFPDAKIVASNSLDEHVIQSLKRQDAKIGVWGVGTNLATAKDQPALGGVYKIAAIQDGNDWKPKLKLSEQKIKISNPGILQIKRFEKDGEFVGDMIHNELQGEPSTNLIVHPMDAIRRKKLEGESEDLLKPIFRGGDLVGEEFIEEDVMKIQERTKESLEKIHGGVKRFENPHPYPAGLSADLHELRSELIEDARNLED